MRPSAPGRAHGWDRRDRRDHRRRCATAVAEAVLTSFEREVPVTDPAGVVAIVAAEGEWHALPGRLAAHAFEAAGLVVPYLGAGVPAGDVARTLPPSGAEVLAVSVTVTANLVGAARTIAAGRSAGPPVLLGGAASSPARAATFGADAHADDVDEGTEVARRWCTDGPATPARSDADLPAAAEISRHRDGSRDRAFEVTEEEWAPLADAPESLIDRVCEDLGCSSTTSPPPCWCRRMTPTSIWCAGWLPSTAGVGYHPRRWTRRSRASNGGRGGARKAAAPAPAGPDRSRHAGRAGRCGRHLVGRRPTDGAGGRSAGGPR